MGEHHPDAETVLAKRFRIEPMRVVPSTPAEAASYALAALAAAGLVVVRDGEPPPWMERWVDDPDSEPAYIMKKDT